MVKTENLDPQLRAALQISPAGLLLSDNFGDAGINRCRDRQELLFGHVLLLHCVFAGGEDDSGAGEFFGALAHFTFFQKDAESFAVRDDLDFGGLSAEGFLRVLDVVEQRVPRLFSFAGDFKDNAVLFWIRVSRNGRRRGVTPPGSRGDGGGTPARGSSATSRCRWECSAAPQFPDK